jgi:hypothetical protein
MSEISGIGETQEPAPPYKRLVFAAVVEAVLLVGSFIVIDLAPNAGIRGAHAPWVVLLLVTVLLAVISVMVPNFQSNSQRRAHNKELLWNEIFAANQLGYVSFYTALIAAKFQTLNEWEVMTMVGVIVLSFFFFTVTSKYVGDQQDKLKHYHPQCRAVVEEDKIRLPDEKLKWPVKWRIFGVNLLLTALAFGIALDFAISPMIARNARSESPVANYMQTTPALPPSK